MNSGGTVQRCQPPCISGGNCCSLCACLPAICDHDQEGVNAIEPWESPNKRRLCFGTTVNCVLVPASPRG